MTRTCVIGGSGFIGAHLVQRLLAHGRSVTVVGRNPLPSKRLPPGVRYFCGDYGEKQFLMQLLKEADEVVDLAYSTVPGTSFENPVEDILTNLPAAVRLFEVASTLPVKKVVVVSSGGTVYGEANAIPISEEHPTNPISPYGVTKLAIEKYAFLFHKVKALPVVAVRPSNAYGEHQRPFTGQGFIATAIASVLEGKEIILYSGRGTVRDYIHAGDVASAIVAALDGGVPGCYYNIGSGTGRSNIDVINAITPLARSSNLVIRTRELPPRQFDVAVNVLDYRRITCATGWVPVISFENGIERTWNWFLTNRYA